MSLVVALSPGPLVSDSLLGGAASSAPPPNYAETKMIQRHTTRTFARPLTSADPPLCYASFWLSCCLPRWQRRNSIPLHSVMDFTIHSSPIRRPWYFLLSKCQDTTHYWEHEETLLPFHHNAQPGKQRGCQCRNGPMMQKILQRQDAEERQEMEDEAYRKRLPENSNKDLIMEFTVQLRKMRNKCLGHKHYCTKEWPTTLSCCDPRTY